MEEGGGLGLRELARELGDAALAEAVRGGARAGAARESFAEEARAAAGAALGLAGVPRRRALVPFGRWAFFEGEVCGAAGGLMARLADGHFAELTAPQAAALLEQRAGASPGAWGLHLPAAHPTGAAGGQRPHVPLTETPAAAELGAGAGDSAVPARPPPSTSESAAPKDLAPPPSPAPVARERSPGTKAPAFHVKVREASPPAPLGGGSGSQGAGGGEGAGTRASAAEPKLRSKFAQEFGRR